MSYPNVIDDPSFRQDYLLLTQSGVTSVAELATRLNVSRTTIDRLRRRLSPDATPPPVRGRPGPNKMPGPCAASRHEHTPRGYREGCRCDETREAWSDYRVDYQRRRREPGYQPRYPSMTKDAEPTYRVHFVAANRARLVGVRRRVHALGLHGHPLHSIAAKAHVGARHLAILCGPSNTGGVTESTAKAIIAACEELGRLPGFSFRAARHAARAGHLPPQAWHGVDIDDPAAEPQEYRVDYDAAADALAALVSRWSKTIGHRCAFITADGSPISGTVSAIDLRQQRGGQVWVEFREHPDPVHVIAFADHPRTGRLPGKPPKKGHLP